MREWKVVAGCVAVAAIALTPLFCAGKRELRVGVAVPLTGEEAAIGATLLNGAKMAAERWNARGGIQGRTVVILEADDVSDPEKAEAAARSLCEKGALFVVGHLDSGCSLRALPVYEKARVVMISPTSTHPDLTEKGSDFVFRVCGRDDRQGRAAAAWIVRNRIEGGVGVIDDASDYGMRLADEFKKNYEFLSGSKVLVSVSQPRASRDFSALVSKVNESKAGIVYFGGISSQGGPLLKALREGGAKALFFTGDACFGAEFIGGAGAQNAEGALCTFIPNMEDYPAAMEIVTAYRQKYGDPGAFGVFGYEAANIGLAAASQAVPPISDRSLRDSLHRLTFQTAFGSLRFDTKGDPTETPYVVWRVEGGKFVEIVE